MYSGIAATGFATAAVAYLIVAGILVLGWRGRAGGLAPMLAVAASVVWGAVLGWLHWQEPVLLPVIAAADALRLAGWYGLLLGLLVAVAPRHTFRLLLTCAVVATGGLLAVAASFLWPPLNLLISGGTALVLTAIVGALLALVLIEQIFRNAGQEARWSLKYLCIGLGTIFVYDLFLFADALLIQRLDTSFWSARGYINALVAPLIAVSAARNPDWSLDVYVSRRFVLHTATLAAAGGYLLLMGAVAYSIQVYGGVWAGPVQTVFLVGSVLVLLMLLFSGQIRARARVFLSKHFYNYRYDYREEWLRFSRTMTSEEGDPRALTVRAVQAVAQVVDSPGGMLWQVRDDRFEPTANWNLPEPPGAAEPVDGELARFLAGQDWVLTIDEWRERPENYDDIPVPAWMESVSRAWLLVPLIHHDRLEGFVLLARSRAGTTQLNWEDFDLLKIIGRQAASYLAQEEAAQALSRAQQFETFNRLSAFVLHDLKNIIGQLSMLARNARRHGDSPEFMADAVETIEHSVERMNQLMNQLRGGLKAGTATAVDLARIVQEAVDARAGTEPAPVVELAGDPVHVRAERERLRAVLTNLVQNAQEATPADGRVGVTLACDDDGATIDIVDTGTGMSREFVRDRLFRPFDTSKGQTGMGIGAFEAREFMRALGGEVKVESSPGEGTRFRLHFPANSLIATQRALPAEDEA